jgi:4-hydroxythreonine-4-phosphate dehydrogenase
MADFIFMLTRDDRTIADAVDRLQTAFDAGVRHIGFKDVGINFAELKRLTAALRQRDVKIYLEVVSLDVASEMESARMAVSLGVDVLMGGTRPAVVLPILAGTVIRYYPFPGTIAGHPSKLVGTIDSIAESAAQLLANDGVHGLDLLAYRFEGDVTALLGRVILVAQSKPVIVAGSIDRIDRIQSAINAGAAGFTIGTAALDGRLPGPADLGGQLATIQRASQSQVDIDGP